MESHLLVTRSCICKNYENNIYKKKKYQHPSNARATLKTNDSTFVDEFDRFL